MTANEPQAPAPRGPLASDRASLVRAGTLTAGALLMAALLVIVNYFGWKYHQRFDWTESQLYSLSEKTKNVLADLDRDVEAIAFLPQGDELYGPTREILSRYEAASPRFSVRELDPERNPREAQRLAEEHDVASFSVVLTSADGRRVIRRDELAEFDYSGVQMGRPPEMRAFKGEALLTGALIELSQDREPKVLFTTGHGEIRLDDLSAAGLGALAQLLRDDSFEVEEWTSLGAAAVPEGTDLLVIAGPTSTFVPPELELFGDYLDRGGRMLVLLDPVLSPVGGNELLATGLEEWLGGWGVEVGRDVVVDPGSPVPFFGSETIYVVDYGEHVTTRSVRDGDLPVFVSLARSVGLGDVPPGYEGSVLLRTTDAGWGETDVSSPEVALGDGDLAGPVPLAVVVEEEVADEEEGAAADADAGADSGESGEGEASEDGASDAPRGPARLVVYGDSDLVRDQLLRSSQSNAVLLIDTLNWLAERESLLGIPPKEPEKVRLSLTVTQQAWITWLALAILPLLAIVAGVVVYLRRRR